MRSTQIGRMLAGAVTALVALVGLAGPATAVPPPPPNPSDGQLQDSKAAASAKAAEVGRLTSQLADAEAKLMQLEADVSTRMEDALKAKVDMETAQEAARRAEADSDAARLEADAAGRAVDDARAELDEFAAGSYKQGSTIGSLSAYVGASSPENLLARAQLLDAVGDSHLDVLDDIERARIHQANKDSTARAALALAEAKQAEAEQAKKVADEATAAAVTARAEQAGTRQQLLATKVQVERQLIAAQSQVSGLQSQRQAYLDWLAAKQREDEERARAAARSVGVADVANVAVSAPRGDARAVIDRALSQLGVIYAWGGGNGSGPTRGIRDGGVADAYGDYDKVGFDCSGLMIYAFAGVGISLPHYSGYQAQAGRRVPLRNMAPGDLLFWANRGRIHHVALYIGNGQMVEAPYSGSRVRIAPVRYGGIVPYATRLL